MKGDSPAVPETDRNLTESRLLERDSTNELSTERTLTGPQASEGSSTLVSNAPNTEEPEEGSESSEETWRQVWTQGSRKRLDDSEVERNLLERNSDSTSGGRPSRYLQDWFNSEDNKSENDLDSNEPDKPEVSQERRKPIKTGSQEGRLKKHEKRESKQPVRPTRFRDIMTSISMAGPSETVSRKKQWKAPTAVRFGKGNNIPHGMKFAVGRETQGHRDKKGPQKDSSDPSNSSDSEESSGEEQPRKHGGRGPGKGKKRRKDLSLTDSSSTSSSDSETELETSSDKTPSSSSSSSDESGSGPAQHYSHKRKHKAPKQKHSKKWSQKWHKESDAECEECKTLTKQKVDPLGMYDGRPDLAIFDKRTYEVNTWIKMAKYHEPTALNLLVKYG